MPVRKYRSVEEMPGVAPRIPLEPENLRIACELSELARKLGGWTLPPGVRRFRSVDEASRARRERENAEIRAGRRRSR
jgi:hypothetical protein